MSRAINVGFQQEQISGPITIDDRTFNTNYNVLDNRNVAQEVWLRGGFELKLAPDLTLKSQAYAYGAERTWFNNEVEAFNSGPQRTWLIGAILCRAQPAAGRQHHRLDLGCEYRRL